MPRATTHGTLHAGPGCSQHSGTLRYRYRLLAMLVLLVSLTAVAPGLPGPAFAADRPLFILKPNPPSAGQDVEVVYTGNNDQAVVFIVGDGDAKQAKPDAGGKFVIPKEELKPGKKLRLIDQDAEDDSGSLCVLIEP